MRLLVLVTNYDTITDLGDDHISDLASVVELVSKHQMGNNQLQFEFLVVL
jgi:hypothetical protein